MEVIAGNGAWWRQVCGKRSEGESPGVMGEDQSGETSFASLASLPLFSHRCIQLAKLEHTCGSTSPLPTTEFSKRVNRHNKVPSTSVPKVFTSLCDAGGCQLGSGLQYHEQILQYSSSRERLIAIGNATTGTCPRH